MFTHVMVGTDDIAASKQFYDAVLGAIGHPAGQPDPKGRIFYRTKTGTFCLTKPIDGNAATHANGGTIGFACANPDQVKAFRDAGVANGASKTRPAGAKGPRASSILPTCAIQAATRSAGCIAAERS